MPRPLGGDSPLVCEDADGDLKLFGWLRFGNFRRDLEKYARLEFFQEWIRDTREKVEKENAKFEKDKSLDVYTVAA